MNMGFNSNNLVFRNALPNQSHELLSLYKSVIDSEFCVWNDNYPSMLEINQDLATDNVFVLTDGEKIAGAISIETHNDMDEFDCWLCNDGTQKEIARVVIAKEYQGLGLAKRLIDEIENVLRQRGCHSVHLAAAKVNIPAYKTYVKAGYITHCEKQMYGGIPYYVMEKVIF